MKSKISDKIKYIGVDDNNLDLFEGQYAIPNGISYNSYIMLDEKVAVIDSVDKRATAKWLENIEKALKGREVDYLVVLHAEPDHSASVLKLAQKYPKMKIVGNIKTFKFLLQFFDIDFENEKIIIKEGDTLSLGTQLLKFYFAPMVHWPEVMMCYEETAKVLFSADAFGKFGTLNTDEDWTCEARRYYFNIVGKYGMQVQSVLKKFAGIEISAICPLHGPMLDNDIGYYLEKYSIWSSYQSEDKGVFIAYASVYGNTKEAALYLANELEKKGCKKVSICDLAREDNAEALEDAFRYDRLVLAAPTLDAGIFPKMKEFVEHLKAKNYQNRKIAVIENGSWAPMVAKLIKKEFETSKKIEFCENVVTLRGKMNNKNITEIEELAKELITNI